MLEGYRALDLTGAEAQLCGRILADLGMDVIRVEKPGGDPCRSLGPFYKDQIHPEKSLWWFVLNANKRGITLNLERNDGRELFKKLVAKSDYVLESFPPGYMAELGLDYARLKAINPRLILTSMTPFGQTGPYRDFKASEIVLMALGVFMFGMGDPDRAPVKLNYPLSLMMSAAHGASATLMAHRHCQKTGLGQHIDVSAQAGVTWCNAMVASWWQMEQRIVPRAGIHLVRRPDLKSRFVWPCRDGEVLFILHGGVAGARSNKALAEWMREEGAGDDFFRSYDWEKHDAFECSQDTMDRLQANIGRFFLGKTRQELAGAAEKKQILLGYIASMGDLRRNPQLASRDFWQGVPHPDLGETITYPRFFVKSSLATSIIRHEAPHIGEHNNEVYREIGLSSAEIQAYNRLGVI